MHKISKKAQNEIMTKQAQNVKRHRPLIFYLLFFFLSKLLFSLFLKNKK